MMVSCPSEGHDKKSIRSDKTINRNGKYAKHNEYDPIILRVLPIKALTSLKSV